MFSEQYSFYGEKRMRMVCHWNRKVKQNIPIGLKARAFEIEYGIPFFQQLNIYQLAEELLNLLKLYTGSFDTCYQR